MASYCEKEAKTLSDQLIGCEDKPEIEHIGEELMQETQRLQEELQQLKTAGNDAQPKLAARLTDEFARLRERTRTAQFVKTRDKVTFLLSFLRVILGAYLLGNDPCSFPKLHVLSGLVLLSIRTVYYRSLRHHYYMIEFCYFANCLTLAFYLVWPESVVLYNVLFAYSFGPLLDACLLLRNSVVLHSVDFMTGDFIHFCPALTLWAVTQGSCGVYPVLPFAEYFAWTVVFYILWCVPYVIIIFFLTYQRSIRKKNVTFYSHTLEAGGAPYYLLSKVRPGLRPVVFVAQHMFAVLLMSNVTYLFIGNEAVMRGLLLGFFSYSVWNGANYYIEYFSSKYELQLKELEKLAATAK